MVGNFQKGRGAENNEKFSNFFTLFLSWGLFNIACFMIRKYKKWNEKIFPTVHVKKEKNWYFQTLGGA